MKKFRASGSDGTGPDRLSGVSLLPCNPLGYHVPNLKAPLGVMLVRTLPLEHTLLAAAWRLRVTRARSVEAITSRWGWVGESSVRPLPPSRTFVTVATAHASG